LAAWASWLGSGNLMTKRSFLPSNRDVAIFGRVLNYFISLLSFFSEICRSKFSKLTGSWPEVTAETQRARPQGRFQRLVKAQCHWTKNTTRSAK
jgi:hypothetical protein